MFIINHRIKFLLIGAAILATAVIIIAVLGLKIGIDFTGGSLTEVSYETAPDKTEVESALAGFDLGGISVRESISEDGGDAYLIQTRDLSEEERIAVSETVTALGEGGEIDRFTSIGPVIGQELADKAMWAIGGVVLIIVLYVAFAFAGIGTPVSSWVYGLVTILVLIHDVLIPTAVMSVLGYLIGAEVDVLFVMALLAVLGYSVNDTIVIFDRVRENLKANRTENVEVVTVVGGTDQQKVTYTLTAPYDELVGMAVKDSLARSINTSLTTFIAITALYFIGGSTTQIFALVLMAGILAGAYSSLFIASPLIVAYEEWKRKKSS